jgi:hypothetical protein
MIHIRLGSKNPISNAERFAPQTPATFDVFFFDAVRQVFEQGFTDKGTVVEHDYFH